MASCLAGRLFACLVGRQAASLGQLSEGSIPSYLVLGLRIRWQLKVAQGGRDLVVVGWKVGWLVCCMLALIWWQLRVESSPEQLPTFK